MAGVRNTTDQLLEKWHKGIDPPGQKEYFDRVLRNIDKTAPVTSNIKNELDALVPN